jgi:hypothetical protein
MITGIETGDITSSSHKCDIIIGMNVDLADVHGIGRRVLQNYEPLRGKLSLGSVITFPWDAERELHLLICHRHGEGGWVGADRHVRYGLDHLNYREGKTERGHGIVQIGKGFHGLRDGADFTSIHTAMATSFLPLTLFINDTPPKQEAMAGEIIPLRPSRVWSMEYGEERLAA